MSDEGFRAALAPRDRALCTAGGVMLLGRGLNLLLARRRRLFGGAMTLTGGALLARSAMASEPARGRARVVHTQPISPAAGAPRGEGISIETPAERAYRSADARIDAASEDSFPASDAPSWTASGSGAPRHGTLG